MELITCCENGLEEKVKELLDSHMNPNIVEILCERTYRLYPMVCYSLFMPFV